MTQVYYYLVLLNAVVSVAVAAAVFWKNRYQLIGPVLGITMLGTAFWLFAFARYFVPMAHPQALFWAKLTLSGSIAINVGYFQSMVLLAGQLRRFRWVVVVAVFSAAVFVGLVWQGSIITGLHETPFMAHYVSYNRALYPSLILHIVGWQLFGAGVILWYAHRADGYRRTQSVYFIIAWAIFFFTTSSIIIPLEYNIQIQPIGFWVLPLNQAFLAYVLSRARMADYNVVIARVLLYSVTIMVVAGISLLFVGTVSLLTPGFMNQRQILFAVLMATTIGIGLTISLPRLLPRAERIMQERLFGGRAGYQEALAGLVRRLSAIPNLDELFVTVTNAIQSEMQLTCVTMLMEDPLSGQFRLHAQTGASLPATDSPDLPHDTPLLEWLRTHRGIVVRDELAREVPEAVLRTLAVDFDRLGATVCVPITMDDRLIGLLALGAKANREMFFISDLNLLSNLATELALVYRFRRTEDEIFHKNKLIELGTVAAGVAHELRNPLASIRTFAQLLPEKVDDPDFKNEFSKLVLSDVDRITRVIESMLSFARPGQVSLADHSLSELVDEAVLLTQPRLKSKRVELVKVFHEQPRVKVDRQKIMQVLINIINNATDALPEHGRIRVATGVRTMESMSGNDGPQRFAAIEISDNGCGIPAAVRGRIFDPFFTTKRDGTGLGLSISQKIVRDHGGVITVSSVEGKGTTFVVNLPMI